ncbi:hypothetical protein GIB67_020803 [Kingdonia uniflora]|uniref:E2F-associated phosphoprotein n=1 Tax=Kingdonia uniflora TaxID=39325 RepID=A0A7J7M7D3_9MAGN|nr:hypothetical protein GIB67_020803 [Kingdonia uniflora]
MKFNLLNKCLICLKFSVSDDDEIDYSTKLEFYDPNLDVKDELWVHKKRKSGTSDVVLSCPACFTTLCLECQRARDVRTQYRAIFVVDCKMMKNDQVSFQNQNSRKRKSRTDSGNSKVETTSGEVLRPVYCSVCSTEVGVRDKDEVYHFFNVLRTES